MTVTIESPKQGETVSGIVTVKAVFQGRGFQYGELSANGGKVGTSISNPMTFLWNAPKGYGLYRLNVLCRCKVRRKTYIESAGINVTVAAPKPSPPKPVPPTVVAGKEDAERRGEPFKGGSERDDDNP